MSNLESSRQDFRVSTRQQEFDLQVIHDFLKTAYWSEDIPFGVVK